MASRPLLPGQLHVLLTLRDGERSFGMSLVQKTSALGLKYTVVSSVFANSPAHRAGVRTGYVVRRINDEPMGGLTVAQVASRFRNVGKAQITLDVAESAVSSKDAASTTFGGQQQLPEASGCFTERPTASVAGSVATSLSGRAIAAPGSALAVSNRAVREQSTLVLGATPIVRSLALQPQVSVVSLDTVKGVPASSTIPQTSVDSIKALGNAASASVVKGREKSVIAAQPKSFPPSGVHATPRSAAEPSTEATTTASAAAPPVSARKSTAPPCSFTTEPIGTTRIQTRTPAALVASIVNSAIRPAQNTSHAPALLALAPKAKQPEITAPVHSTVPARENTRLPIEGMLGSEAELAGGKTVSVSAQNIARTIVVASVSAPPSPMTVPTSTTTKIGKKRGRPPSNVSLSETENDKGTGKVKKAVKQQQHVDELDSFMNDDDDDYEDAYDSSAVASDYDSDELSPKKSARCKVHSRRRGPTDRVRHSLTIDRLIAMGFRKEDAEASVKEIGDHLDACMVWIISKIEERQFNEDLNQASIQSEQSKQDEKVRVEKLEKETLAHAEKFMAVFPTSYMVSPECTASHFKTFLQSTIDQVDGESYLREVLTELMKLEASDVDSANGCEFVRTLVQEVKALTSALFEMPINQGGVPQVFLECDETTKFDLEDDGFEVVE